MDSEEEIFDDSGNESSGESDSDTGLCLDHLSGRDRLDVEEEFIFEVLSTEEIVQHMIDCIKEVNMIVEIPPTTTRILLNHFNWDKEKLYERYYDGDPERLFKEAHVINPNNRLLKKSSSSNKVLELCEICFQELPLNMMTGLACGHRFCTECWTVYLTTKIMEHGDVQTIPCSAVGCDIVVDDQTVMNLITDPKVKLKYQHLITNSFISCNRLLQYCPQPDCNNVIKVQYTEARPVTCKCGHTFCFQCLKNWHDPVKCLYLKKWQKKCDDDSETSNWIAANTKFVGALDFTKLQAVAQLECGTRCSKKHTSEKECPKCNITIEKDGGCNHMICKNQSCKFDFCWVCLGPWNPHGSAWYNCNRYDEEVAKAARHAQEKSRSALQRYLFYCNRYMNHMQSLKFENKLYASVKEKMEEMQQHNMSWIEVQFLKKAVDVLCQCRQTLMYTYVFAYYLKRNNQSAIFEDNQSDLENATEQLSEYLERDITQENLLGIKQKVQDKYRYCDTRRKVLLDHVHEGYEKECWEYTE